LERLAGQCASLAVIVRRRPLAASDWEAQGIAVLEHDGSTSSLMELVARAEPHVVYHLATHFVARHDTPDVDPMVRSNILFGTQLLEALAAADVRRVVNVGTAWQHYLGAEARAVSLYAATKQAFEAILTYYCDAHAMRAVSLHLADSYGPTDTRSKLLTLLRQAAAGTAPLRMSPGEQQIDLLHVEDVVDALLEAGRRTQMMQAGHDTFRVSSGHPVTLRELVARFEQAIGRQIPIEWGAVPYRPRESMEPWQGGEQLPGWQPRIGLDDGLRQLAI
jgi:nucleoside-diphosphate-sugar epimerase